MTCTSRLRLSVLGLALALAACATPARATGPGYYIDETVAQGIDAPSNSEFLPDGRLFVVGQFTAQVSLVVDGAPAAKYLVGTIPNVRSGGEAGLVGVTVDPGFPSRPYLYVHATHSSPNEIRVTRYTLTGDLGFAGNGAMTIDPASARIVLGALPDAAAKHNGGTLRFGPDGMLYVALGDDDNPCRAQDLTKLQGKILRLDVSTLPAGGGPAPLYAAITPPDNPFVAHPDSAARLVWALGLRNPFSFTIDPPTGCLVIGDVGNDSWEEIDVACTGGMNFGWPHFEGPWRTPLTCSDIDTTAFVGAGYEYEHVGLGYAVFAGPIYRAPVGATDPFPLASEGMLFMGDTWKGWVRRLAPDGPGWIVSPPEYLQPDSVTWANAPRYITSMHVGPKDGSLWYTMLYRTVPSSGPGEVRRFRYIGPTTGVDPSPGPPTPAGELEFVRAQPSPVRRGAHVDLVWRQSAPGPVTLRVFDVSGRLVRTLATTAQGARPAGEQRASWNGRDAAGRLAATGVYVAELRGRGVVRTLRLVRL